MIDLVYEKKPVNSRNFKAKILKFFEKFGAKKNGETTVVHKQETAKIKNKIRLLEKQTLLAYYGILLAYYCILLAYYAYF